MGMYFTYVYRKGVIKLPKYMQLVKNIHEKTLNRSPLRMCDLLILVFTRCCTFYFLYSVLH